MGWSVYSCGTVALMVLGGPQISGNWPRNIRVNVPQLECLTQLSTLFWLYRVIRDGQFYWWRKQEYLEKTTDLCHEALTNFITCIWLVVPLHLTLGPGWLNEKGSGIT
jgi:hypothetical protein